MTSPSRSRSWIRLIALLSLVFVPVTTYPMKLLLLSHPDNKTLLYNRTNSHKPNRELHPCIRFAHLNEWSKLK